MWTLVQSEGGAGTRGIPSREPFGNGRACGLKWVRFFSEFYMTRRLVAFAFMFLAPSSTFLGQAAPTPADFTFSVASTYVWTDTGLDLQPGDLLQISAGTEESSAPDRHALPAAQCDPGGTTAAASGTTLPLPSAPMGALIAKLHPSSTGILIGAGSELRIEE